MKTDPRTDTLLKTYLVYVLVLLFGVAVIAKIIVMQTKDTRTPDFLCLSAGIC